MGVKVKKINNDKKKKKALLEYCDNRFYPYIDKVLERLPEEVRSKEVLDDSMLKIISFDSKSYGSLVPLETPVKQFNYTERNSFKPTRISNCSYYSA